MLSKKNFLASVLTPYLLRNGLPIYRQDEILN